MDGIKLRLNGHKQALEREDAGTHTQQRQRQENAAKGKKTLRVRAKIWEVRKVVKK